MATAQPALLPGSLIRTLAPVDAQRPTDLPPDYVFNDRRSFGNYTIQLWRHVQDPEGVLSGLATVSAPDQSTVQIEYVQAFADLPAADVTGEGEPDVAFAMRAIGSGHCCWGITVYNLGSSPTRVLNVWTPPYAYWEQKDFRDLNGDGRFEFITRELVSGLDCTAPSAQVVLELEPGRGYVPASPRFVSAYADLIAYNTKVAEAAQPEAAKGYKCGVLGLVLNYLYSGQAETAWSELRRLYTAPDADEFRAQILQAVKQNPMFVQEAQADSSSPTADSTVSPASQTNRAPQTACDHPFLPLKLGARWIYTQTQAHASSDGYAPSPVLWMVTSLRGDADQAMASVSVSGFEKFKCRSWSGIAPIGYDYTMPGFGSMFHLFLRPADQLTPGATWNGFSIQRMDLGGGMVALYEDLTETYTVTGNRKVKFDGQYYDGLQITKVATAHITGCGYVPSCANADGTLGQDTDYQVTTSVTFTLARGVGIVQVVETENATATSATTTRTYTLTDISLPEDVRVPSPTPGCDYAWFFPNPPGECPAQPPVYHYMIAQPFEHGLILLRKDSDTFVIFIDDNIGRDWIFAGNRWNASLPESDPNIVPPPGLFQPKRGFGLLWREGAQGPPLRDRLGWATSEEFEYGPVAEQWHQASEYRRVYIAAPSDVVYVAESRYDPSFGMLPAPWYVWAGPTSRP